MELYKSEFLFVIVNLTLQFTQCNTARILGVFPTPSISHQLVYRRLMLELVNRGHNVVVITTDPVYSKGLAPSNLTEIDVHDISYKIKNEASAAKENKMYTRHQSLTKTFIVLSLIFEEQMKTNEVQDILSDKNQTFDLLILEEFVRPTLGLSSIYNVPVILISSLSSAFGNYADLGISSHPLIYPSVWNQRLYNLTVWEKIIEIFKSLRIIYTFRSLEDEEDKILKRIFGLSTPPMKDLIKNVDLLFLNVHPIWDFNRPVPPNIIYMGGVHQKPSQALPRDLQSYMDISKRGIIYISFGSNVRTEDLPEEFLKVILKVLSELPYDVIWKCDSNELKNRSRNIKIMKWLPQADLLKHPKVKLFITQGGLQSTDEAIAAGVPLLGIPMMYEQWYNTEKYVHYGLGYKLNMETVTEDELRSVIIKIIEDDTYRDNVVKFRKLINDQPQKPLERAIWWTEYLLRHGKARHLRSPAANISWVEFLELQVLAIVFSLFLVIMTFFFIVISLLNRCAKVIVKNMKSYDNNTKPDKNIKIS